MRVGDNIRQIRSNKKLKRADLVKKMRFIYGDSAVDYRTIERIERGDIKKGHLSTLLQIADGLEATVEELLKGTLYEDRSRHEELSEEVYLTRASSRSGTFAYNDRAKLEIISPGGSGYISCILKIEPRGRTTDEQDPEGTIKFLYMIDGEFLMTAGGIKRALRRGDFVQINSHKLHYFENRSRKSATALLYQNPKRF